MLDLFTINIAIDASGLSISFIGLALVLADNLMDRREKRFLVVFFAVLVAYVISDLLSTMTESRPSASWAVATQVLIFLESLFSSLLLIMLAGLLQRALNRANVFSSPVFRASLLLFVVYLVMLIYAQFSTSFYFVSESNVYQRGPLYPALLLPPVIITLLNLLELLHRGKSLSDKKKLAFTMYLFMPAIGMAAQMAIYGVRFIVLGTSIGALFLLIAILNEQSRSYYRQKEEIRKLKNDLVLSQIQPHFLSNALGAIGALCEGVPEAREAIDKFSLYLRESIDAVSQDAPVPFDREIDHTRTYLELEQLRFGEDLRVVYDLECTDFELPVLTLQPLAENAVRHGVRASEDGEGTVEITTREYSDRWEISVIDDGAGFDPDRPPNDGRVHVGLTSVRERLRVVSGGRLEIQSAPGEGARVTVVLPKDW